uniref:Uncharacterized protein n=1 Tax=Tanacetum cinerariifolium TaxID=118510 RepID=A0A699GFH0_TANCI|nr:hypothetical protein [Tanacetum cinerariifolium]
MAEDVMGHVLGQHVGDRFVGLREVDHAARYQHALAVGIGVDVVRVADVDPERARARDRHLERHVDVLAFDDQAGGLAAGGKRSEDGGRLGFGVGAGGQILAVGGDQDVAFFQAGLGRAAAGQHAGHFQAVAVIEHGAGGIDVFARVRVAVFGGKAQQVARLAAAQVRVVDQDGRGNAVKAVLQRHHAAQFFACGGHLGRDDRIAFVDGARDRRFGRRFGRAYRVGRAGCQQRRPSGATFAAAEVVDDIKTDLQHRHDDQLGQAFHRVERERAVAAVPGGDHQLALVIGVDQAYQIPQHDAVLVAHAAARQDHGGVARIGHVDRQAGGDEDRLAGIDDHGRIDARAQVEPCGTRCGVGRQLVFHARVEDLDVDSIHIYFENSECWVMRLEISDISWRASVSLSARGRMVWPFSSNRMMVLSSWPKVFRFGGKAHAVRVARQRRARGHGGQDVRVLFELQVGHRTVGIFFQFLFAGVGDAPVGHRRHRDEDVLMVDVGHHRVVHLHRALHVDALHPERRGQRRGAGHQHHLGACFARGARHGITHFAGRQIGDAAHRVDGLERGTGRDQDALTGQHLGLERCDQLFEQLHGFEHAAHADFTAGLVAGGRAEDDDAVFLELARIAAGGRVLPHLHVHGRRNQERHVARARQAHGGEQVVAHAVRQLGHEVGRAGRDHDRVRVAGDVDVGHVVVHARIPLAGKHLVARQGLHGDGRDEMLGGVGHHHLHRGAGLGQRAAQLIEDEQRGADADGRIGDIKRREVAEALPVKIEEVDHVAVQHAVDDVAHRAAEDQRQRPREHALAAMLFQQVDDVDRRAHADGGEEVPLPAARIVQEAEGRALVIGQHQVEERCDEFFLAQLEGAGNGDLGQLVDQDDDEGNAQPGCEAGRGFGREDFFGGHKISRVFVMLLALSRARGYPSRACAANSVAVAAAAQGRMVGVGAHVGAVVPAALALLSRRCRHGHHFVRFVRHLGHLRGRRDEDEFEVVVQAGEQLVLVARRLDRQLRLQRRTDGARRAQVFQLLGHVRAHGAQRRVLGQQRAGIGLLRQLPPGLRKDGLVAGRIRFGAGKDGPRFFRRERQGRGHHAQQALRDVPQRGLRRAARRRIHGRRVQAVLEDVEVEAAQVFRAVVLDLRVHGLEFILRVVLGDFFLQRGHVGQRVAVDFQHLLDRHGVLRMVEVRRIGQQEAQRVADAAIRFRHALEDLVGDRQLARVVGGRDPQAQDVGAQAVRDLLRRQRVTERLRHLLAFAVDREAVREQRLVGRAAVQHGAGQQRRVEPAAVLVRAFQVQVRRVGQLFLVRAAQHRLVRHARVEPHVQRVLVLFVAGRFIAEQVFQVERQPGVDAALLDALRDLLQQFRSARMQRARLLVHDEGHRHAPLALTRQGPVGTVGDHAVQARLAPVGEEFGLLDAGQRALAQRGAAVGGRDVHARKPLRCGAVDDRGFMAPAVHIAVREHLQFEQRARFAQRVADRLGRFPDRQPAEQRQGRSELAVAHDWREHLFVLHAMRAARDEVVQAIGWRRVHHAGAAFGGHVVGQVHGRQAVVECVCCVQRMAEADVFQRRAQGRGNCRAFELEARQRRFDQVLRQDQEQRLAVTLGLHQRVGHFRIDVQRLVGRDGPRGGGPDDDKAVLGGQLRQVERFGQLVELGKLEADVDGRIALLVVFHFRLGQRRLAVEAPVHRFQAAVHIAFFQQLAERAQFVGLVRVVHGQIRILPLAQHAQADKVLALAVDLLERVGAGLGQHFGRRQVFAVQFFDLDFDRHAVAIPARHVGRVEAGQRARLDHHVLEDLVDRVAQVDVAVGVRRTVMQDEFRTAGGGLAHALVDFLFLPLLHPLRLALGQDIRGIRGSRRAWLIARSNSVGGRSGAIAGVGAGLVAAPREISAGDVGVAVDGGSERGQVDVFFLVTDLLQEFHPHLLAVAVLREVEHVHFQQHAAAVIDRGAHAQAGYGRQRLFGQAVDLDDEDAHQRRAVRHPQIQRGETQRAAQLLAVDHVAGHGVRVAQQRFGADEVAFGQRGAHGGRRDARGAVHHGRQGFDVEAVALARFQQHLHIAGAARAVAEVVTDHQPFDVQAFDQHFFREFLRREGGKRRREMLDDHAVDAVVGQRLQLVAQVGDARRGARQVPRFLREKFAWVRFERHHGRFQSEAAGGIAHARQQCLVAEVDTVEIADRERARRTRRCVG